MTIPKRSWFLLQPPSDLHGLGHAARVMAWACVPLTRQTEWLARSSGQRPATTCAAKTTAPIPDHGFHAALGAPRTAANAAPLAADRPGVDRRRPATGTCALIATQAGITRCCGISRTLTASTAPLCRPRCIVLQPPGNARVGPGHKRLFTATHTLDDPRMWQVALGQACPWRSWSHWSRAPTYFTTECGAALAWSDRTWMAPGPRLTSCEPMAVGEGFACKAQACGYPGVLVSQRAK